MHSKMDEDTTKGVLLKHYYSLGLTGAEALKQIVTLEGESFISQYMVYKAFRDFKESGLASGVPADSLPKYTPKKRPPLPEGHVPKPRKPRVKKVKDAPEPKKVLPSKVENPPPVIEAIPEALPLKVENPPPVIEAIPAVQTQEASSTPIPMQVDTAKSKPKKKKKKAELAEGEEPKKKKKKVKAELADGEEPKKKKKKVKAELADGEEPKKKKKKSKKDKAELADGEEPKKKKKKSKEDKGSEPAISAPIPVLNEVVALIIETQAFELPAVAPIIETQDASLPIVAPIIETQAVPLPVAVKQENISTVDVKPNLDWYDANQAVPIEIKKEALPFHDIVGKEALKVENAAFDSFEESDGGN